MRILVIIPAYNEEDSIQRVINELVSNYPQYDYLIINDGSNDRTKEICRKNSYNMLDFPVNLGLASGVQAGFKYAFEMGYDAAIQFDGDGQHQPQYIATMVQELEVADIVIGSRFVEKSKPKSIRMLGSNIIQIAIKLTTGVTIHDPTSGMRLINRKMMKEFAYNMNYGPEPDTISYMIGNGARVKEVQVEMLERTAGESYLNFKHSIIYMFRMCMSIVFIQKFRRRGV